MPVGKCGSLTRMLQMNPPKESALLLLFFSLSLKARVAMRFTADWNGRVIKMQIVTLWIDINCEVHAVKEFREWQTSLCKTLNFRAISFSKGCGGGGGGGGSDEHVCIISLFQNYWCDRIIDLERSLFILKSVKYKFLGFHRLKLILFILF